MDILSNHRITFNAGVWLRAHKFNPITVGIVKSLQLIAKLREQRDTLDFQIEAEEDRLRAMVVAVEQKQDGK